MGTKPLAVGSVDLYQVTWTRLPSLAPEGLRQLLTQPTFLILVTTNSLLAVSSPALLNRWLFPGCSYSLSLPPLFPLATRFPTCALKCSPHQLSKGHTPRKAFSVAPGAVVSTSALFSRETQDAAHWKRASRGSCPLHQTVSL